MISRLTAVSTTVAVVTAFTLVFISASRAPTTVATLSAATAKQVRFIELAPVLVVGKRLQRTNPS